MFSPAFCYQPLLNAYCQNSNLIEFWVSDFFDWIKTSENRGKQDKSTRRDFTEGRKNVKVHI